LQMRERVCGGEKSWGDKVRVVVGALEDSDRRWLFPNRDAPHGRDAVRRLSIDFP
jgi:hypothetical protein